MTGFIIRKAVELHTSVTICVLYEHNSWTKFSHEFGRPIHVANITRRLVMVSNDVLSAKTFICRSDRSNSKNCATL